MKPILGTCALILALCSLSACQSADKLVSAEPLDRTAIITTLKNSGISSPSPKDDVLAYLSQSQTKCAAFLNNLVVQHTASDTFLDIATIGATATATAITAPLTAIHVATGIGTLTAGAKASIDNDYFAKASVANLAQAIQTTYYTKLDQYYTALQAATSVDPSLEYFAIERIHSLCALGPAEGTISAALTSPPTISPSDTSEYDITIGGGPAAKADSFTLSGKSNIISIIPDATVVFNKDATSDGIAKALAVQIANSLHIVQPTITGTVVSGKPSVVAVTDRKADQITWTIKPPKVASGITVTGAPASPATGTGTGALEPVTPGSSVTPSVTDTTGSPPAAPPPPPPPPNLPSAPAQSPVVHVVPGQAPAH